MLPFMVHGQSVAISCPSDTICTGVTVHFTATAAGVVAPHFRWQVNGTVAGSDTGSFSTSTLNTGDSIQCLLTNTAGDTVFCVSNVIAMAVDYFPDAGIITGSDIVCLGATIILTDTMVGGWWASANNNTTISGDTVRGGRLNSSEFWDYASTDTIYYIVGNSCGFDTARKALTIERWPRASFFLDNSPICLGGVVSVNGEAGYRGHLYSLYGNVGCNWWAVYGIHLGNDVLVGIDSTYCGVDTFKMGTTVFDNPHGGAILASKIHICAGDSVRLIDTGSIGYSSQWTATGGHGGVNGNGWFFGTSAGVETIHFVVSNQCGYTSASKDITIDPPYPIKNDTNVCVGATINLADSSGGGTWSSVNPLIASIHPVTGGVTGISGGEDTIVYRLPSGCSTKTTLTIHPLPAPIVTDNIVCSESEFTVTESGGIWSVDSSGILKMLNPYGGNFIAKNKGFTTIKYTLPTGCFDTLKILVIDCDQQINVFPNPATTEVVIQADTSAYHDIVISNVLGQILVRQPITSEITQIGIASLPRGVYIITVYGYFGYTFNSKIVKE